MSCQAGTWKNLWEVPWLLQSKADSWSYHPDDPSAPLQPHNFWAHWRSLSDFSVTACAEAKRIWFNPATPGSWCASSQTYIEWQPPEPSPTSPCHECGEAPTPPHNIVDYKRRKISGETRLNVRLRNSRISLACVDLVWKSELAVI